MSQSRPVFLTFVHDQSPRVFNIFEVYNLAAIFNLLNSHEYFPCMSVTETSLPETYEIFSKKLNSNLKV